MTNTLIASPSFRGSIRIGVIVPMTNTNLEPDLMMLRPVEASLHFMRIGGYDINKVPNSDEMRQLGLVSLDSVIDTIMAVQPHVILYGCTSATLAHGPSFDKKFAKDIYNRCGVKTITAAGGIIEVLEALQIKKIAFASPYVEELNKESIDFLSKCNFEIVSSADVGADLGNYGHGELTLEEVYDLGIRANSDEAEALVLSCTDMRAVEVIEALEQELKKPVVTSNQALIWAAAKYLNLKDE